MCPTAVRPLIVFSLPRSGSTLVQRLLATDRSVATSPETWLLLPLMLAVRPDLAIPRYQGRVAEGALSDFLAPIGGSSALATSLARSASDMYRLAATEDATWFVDKTPRYGLICEEIIKAMRDLNAGFVFVWRHPVSVVESMGRTWYGGKWPLFRHQWDLDDMFLNLHRVWRSVREDADVVTVRYEDLVKDSRTFERQIEDQFQITIRRSKLNSVPSSSYQGMVGDPSPISLSELIPDDARASWEYVQRSLVRRRWLREYLARHRLALLEIGYELELKKGDSGGHVRGARRSTLISDLGLEALRLVYRALGPSIAWKLDDALREVPTKAGRRRRASG